MIGQALALRSGDFLFRWRSYLPLVLLPLVAVAVGRSQYPFRTHIADLAWESGCVVVALAGLSLRVWTVGTAAPGTSGRNTRRQKASSLNTTGPYSLVRHPLYIGNGVIVLGLALFPHAWAAPALVAGLTLGYYALIARREEAYLRERFGAQFEAWAARVPALWPRRWRYVPPDRPFDWRRVVRQEFHALALILVAPCLLDILEDFHDTGAFDLDLVWTAVGVLGAVLFVVLRWVKRHTTLLAPPGRTTLGRRATPAP